MQKFWEGFYKAAENKEEGRSWVKPALAGLGTAAGAYALMRGRKPKTKLTRTMLEKAPKTWLGKAFHKGIYGADDMVYLSGGRAPKKAKRIAGTVLHENPGDIRYVRGERNIGGFSKSKEKQLEDKLIESRMMQKAVPSLHPGTRSAKVTGGGKKNIEALNKQKKDYILKARGGYNTGVGDVALLTKKEIGAALAGKRLKGKKQKLLEKVIKNPDKFIQQGALEIKRSPLTNASSELRVHAIGNKVIPGATMVRGKNVEDVIHMRKAEKALQNMLDKLPPSKVKDLTHAADVAITKGNKPAIIELNRGAHQSGFLDPRHLAAQAGGGLKGLAAGALSTKANQAIYKHLTGRASALEAGGKALAAGGVASTLANYRLKKKER